MHKDYSDIGFIAAYFVILLLFMGIGAMFAAWMHDFGDFWDNIP